MAPSGLIGQANSGRTKYDSTCPECGSENVTRNSMFSLEEQDSVAPVCEECDHSWFEAV